MGGILEKLKNLHSDIANDVWPDGLDGNVCCKCGRTYYMTAEQCNYALAHGWHNNCQECDSAGGE